VQSGSWRLIEQQLTLPIVVEGITDNCVGGSRVEKYLLVQLFLTVRHEEYCKVDLLGEYRGERTAVCLQWKLAEHRSALFVKDRVVDVGGDPVAPFEDRLEKEFEEVELQSRFFM